MLSVRTKHFQQVLLFFLKRQNSNKLSQHSILNILEKKYLLKRKQY